MHRQIWRAAVPLLLLAAVCGALWPLRRFLTAEAISRASPEQLWLAAGFLLLLYGVKSVSFCFPMSALTAAGGLLFPYPAALAVNLTGTAVAQTLPFLMGRWNRQWAAGVLSRFPKAGRFLSQEQGREGLLVFLLRLAGASPGDLVSLALGAAGIPPSRYLVPGVLGAAPRVAAATLLLCINLRVQAGIPFGDSITDAAFQTVTIMTTTGFATVDFALWPTFCRMALLVLMFTGGCAGSTSGGIKLSRVLILWKSLVRELKRMVHPNHVSVIKVDGQPVEERVVSSTGAYIMAYMAVLLAGALVVSWDNFGFQESFAASLTCISNVGPGLGILGPMENFSILSPLSKIALSLEMLTGRLELMPMLALLTRGAWRDR